MNVSGTLTPGFNPYKLICVDLHRPVYVVSGGDLGTTAATLDRELKMIFDLSPIWDAIVLIDEADVFLEERSSINLERNAMVAVFLRQIE